ncbi:hypothetical protein SLS62_000934 [Diatrype stigma]|uniref:Uncharacterized protein n=1 Tax=Diatrype stigma TaxID=117547 RepID=A0AAN9YS44_9PEZI
MEVIGHCGGLSYGGARHGAFQNFATLREAVAATIPDSLSFERAVVLPLGLSTASCGLHEFLKLRLPTANADVDSNGETSDGSSKPKEAVLIWGGSSSMGTVAIQLAVAAGYRVITTASERNHDYVRSLVKAGSIVVFGHSDPDDVARKIIEHIKSSGEVFAGAYDCISTEQTARACEEVVHAFGGGALALVLPMAEARYEDVRAEVVWATKPGYVPGHPGAELWSKFVSEALEGGVLQAKPDPLVVGHGLGKIQEAMDILKKGVSAKKIVVTL